MDDKQMNSKTFLGFYYLLLGARKEKNVGVDGVKISNRIFFFESKLITS